MCVCVGGVPGNWDGNVFKVMSSGVWSGRESEGQFEEKVRKANRGLGRIPSLEAFGSSGLDGNEYKWGLGYVLGVRYSSWWSSVCT